MRLKNKKVVITGAINQKGIGFGIANLFAEQGAELVVTFLSESDEIVEQSVKILKQYGTNIYTKRTDITSENEVKSLFDFACEKMGQLDILINNAGVCIWENIQDVSSQSMETLINVNLIGTMTCCKYAVLHMIDRKIKGRIINISSCNARRPNPGMAGYGAVKAGIDLLTQSLSLEAAKFGITVNQIWPGYILTDINKGQPGGMDDDTATKALRTIPIGQIAEPKDVAQAVLFLAEEKNQTVTGAVIKVDGGAFIKCLQ
ncbi:SDR family oxidoreductase [Enterococcus hulanensis]|uniref:SDR family NAD(P)-dependent oxidoreductase n=1 Tax=Enterococcus hulanensis TaxID=2559929 RepID=UPI001A8D817D|nr:SDR family NAD(P)-dependent oxidoreductase [Enterococcus hulanensis]MBO0455999.1 SDR family oxidoreductase [Enterococcus hulanensis]